MVGDHHDSQPTSRKFTERCAYLEIEQIFTNYGTPGDNADIEVIRTKMVQCVGCDNTEVSQRKTDIGQTKNI
jgi:transposase InsO family protein